MAEIRYLTTIQVEAGALRLLPAECARVGMRRPLIVTDAGVRDAGLLARALTVLGDALPCAVFDGTPSNPTEAAVRAAVQRFRDHRCDGLIALGGGSARP